MKPQESSDSLLKAVSSGLQVSGFRGSGVWGLKVQGFGALGFRFRIQGVEGV